MLSWIPYALSGAIFIGMYNLALEGAGKEIGTDYNTKIAFMMLVLVSVGILSGVVLLFQSIKNKKSMEKSIKIITDTPWKLIVPSILIPLYMVANILALSDGGGIVMGVINLNVLVTLIGGAFLLGDKINSKIIISLLFAMGFITYASYESSLLK